MRPCNLKQHSGSRIITMSGTTILKGKATVNTVPWPNLVHVHIISVDLQFQFHMKGIVENEGRKLITDLHQVF
jgi:hypothetical protein